MDEIKQTIKAASESGRMAGYIGYTEDQVRAATAAVNGRG